MDFLLAHDERAQQSVFCGVANLLNLGLSVATEPDRTLSARSATAALGREDRRRAIRRSRSVSKAECASVAFGLSVGILG